MNSPEQEARTFFQQLTPEKRAAIKKLVELFGCAKATIKPAPQHEELDLPTKKDWSMADKALIQKFFELERKEMLPAPPFRLDTATTITDTKFYDSIKCDIDKGPDGTRARSGALQCNLKKLFEFNP